MGRAQGIISKIDAVFNRLQVTDRTVVSRVIQVSGGDPLTGRGATATNVDTVLDPQPVIVQASNAYPLVIAGQALSADAQYLMTVSVSAMARADVANPELTIVFQDDNDNEEELYIVGFSATYLNGTDISFSCILASKKR